MTIDARLNYTMYKLDKIIMAYPIISDTYFRGLILYTIHELYDNIKTTNNYFQIHKIIKNELNDDDLIDIISKIYKEVELV